MIDLTDIVFVYNDGLNHKIVSADLAFNNCIIYDKFYENSVAYDVTVTFCKNTGCATGYFGKFMLGNNLYKNNITLINNDGVKIVQLTGDIMDLDNNNNNNNNSQPFIRRLEVRVGVLRDVLSKHPDSKCVNLTKIDIKSKSKSKSKSISNIINLEFNPRTVVYGVEYISSDETPVYKHSVIIGKDSSQSRANSVSDKASGFKQYFDKVDKQLQSKHAFLIPCYFGAWISFYPNSRIVRLSTDHQEEFAGGCKLFIV